jgi:hypothetical protein
MRKQSSKELTNEYNILEKLKEHQKRWKNILRDQKYVKKERITIGRKKKR